MRDKSITLGDTDSFKDIRGVKRNKNLFLETHTSTNEENEYSPLFTLSHKPKDDLLCIRDLYLSYDDPTEYQFATDIFGSVAYWQDLAGRSWLKEYVEEWRTQAEARRRAGVFAKMDGIISNGESKDTAIISAGKAILNETWKVEGKKPSVKEKKAQLHSITGGKAPTPVNNVLESISRRKT